MKTRTLVVLYMILFLTGLVITGFSQGLTNNGGYITGSSTNYITFSGGSDMTLKSTTADRTTFGNMKVDFTGTGTYKLTIPDDSYITLAGNLTLSDTLLLEASSSGMASLVMSSATATVTGAYAKVQQHLVQDQWHIISSPVSSAQSGVYTDCYLYEWDETDSSFAFISSTTASLNVAEGYHVWSSSGVGGIIVGPTDVEFSGLLNTGNYSPSLSYTSGSGKGNGWNEIGNPFPSAVEWNSSWTKTNIDATIYIYDGSSYKTWNYNYTGSPNTLSSGEIPSTQGFWVKANAASPALTIPNSERLHSSQSFYKSDETIEDIFDIIISGNSYSDQMSVGFFAEATDDFDSEYDAYKLFGIEAIPQLYSINNDTKFAINLLSEINEDKEIPLGLRVGAAMEYTFEVEGLDNFDLSIGVYLEDKLSGDFIDLRENPIYTFYTEEGLNEDRFVLHFTVDALDIEEYGLDSNINIYASDKTIYINYQMNNQGNVTIYDILGKEIITEDLNTKQLNKLTVNNGKGYYIVKVVSGNSVKTGKVYIN